MNLSEMARTMGKKGGIVSSKNRWGRKSKEEISEIMSKMRRGEKLGM